MIPATTTVRGSKQGVEGGGSPPVFSTSTEIKTTETVEFRVLISTHIPLFRILHSSHFFFTLFLWFVFISLCVYFQRCSSVAGGLYSAMSRSTTLVSVSVFVCFFVCLVFRALCMLFNSLRGVYMSVYIDQGMCRI